MLTETYLIEPNYPGQNPGLIVRYMQSLPLVCGERLKAGSPIEADMEKLEQNRGELEPLLRDGLIKITSKGGVPFSFKRLNKFAISPGLQQILEALDPEPKETPILIIPPVVEVRHEEPALEPVPEEPVLPPVELEEPELLVPEESPVEMEEVAPSLDEVRELMEGLPDPVTKEQGKSDAFFGGLRDHIRKTRETPAAGSESRARKTRKTRVE